jgi:hypothetical protein
MARGAPVVFICLLLLTTSHDGVAAPRAVSAIRRGSAVMASPGTRPLAGGGASTLAWVMDCADDAGGPMEAWLRTKGFW